jgi:putative flippase GtrA
MINQFNAQRWTRFNAVGVAGFVVQLGCLWALTHVMNLHYVLATAVAVELTILHNFVWHSQWTWRDRSAARGQTVSRFARFNLTNGVISIVANMFITAALVEHWHVHYLVANGISVAACAVANFMASELLVFTVLMMAVATPIEAAELNPQAAEAFDRYARLTESRLDREKRGDLPFLSMDALPEGERRDTRARLQRGEVVIRRQQIADVSGFPDALCHHWIGTVLVPSASIAGIIDVMQRYDRYAVIYSPAIRQGKTLAHDGNSFRVYLQLFQKKVLTALLNTESIVTYVPVSPSRMQVRSISTRIAEVQGSGNGEERENPIGRDSGFLWRFNNYCALENRAEGTYVQCETVSLSRDVPFGLGWLVGPFVTSIPKESLEFTLQALREAVKQISMNAANSNRPLR